MPHPPLPPPARRRALADALAGVVVAGGPAPDRARLDAWAAAGLARAGLDPGQHGYALVLASNAWWAPAFAAVPHRRRLLLLPHCLRPAATCPAPADAAGVHCRGCGGCDIAALRAEADALGWRVLVAEGVTAMLAELVDEGRDGVLGVACLASLERSFERVRELGVPHLAVPLDADGCECTSVDLAQLRALMRLHAPAAAGHLSWLPLMREAAALTSPATLARLLAGRAGGDGPVDGPALAWLGGGGKRLRAFIALAAWAAARHGEAALRPDADLAALLPDGARRLALAIEVLHKASLVHDDIQDGDGWRDGRPTLHRRHGVPAAINHGDFLVGLGYRLALDGAAECGGAAAALAVGRLFAAAQVEMCRGQGIELALRGGGALRARDALAIAADKTAPAFAAALGAGLAAAGTEAPGADRFARCLGEAYQVLDDLDDARAGEGDRDLRAGQPTILRALALERLSPAELERGADEDEAAWCARVRGLYRSSGAIGRAADLADRLRARAEAAAAGLGPPAVAALGGFLARTLLAARAPAHP